MSFNLTSLGFCGAAIFVESWSNGCLDGSKWCVLLKQVFHGSVINREEAVDIKYGGLDDRFDELTV